MMEEGEREKRRREHVLSLSLPLCPLFLFNAVEFTFCQLRTDLECTVWLVLFILGRPQQLDLDVQLAVGLEVHPDLVERLLRLADQVGEREFAVGDEVVGGNGGTGGINMRSMLQEEYRQIDKKHHL